MINASELRLLNYLQFNKNVFQVKEIKILKNRFNVNGRPPSYFEGIKLTEELFLNAGFKKYNDSETFYFWESSIFSIEKDTKNFKVYVMNEVSICELNFLHELQNLYFSLTGSELVFSTEP